MALAWLPAALLLLALAGGARADAGAEWPWTEGAPGGGRWSPLADIHRGNVGALEEVWRYRHGDVHRASGLRPDRVNRSTAFEATPLVVDGRLVFSTPFNRVIALDPASGQELWSFDPGIDRGRFFANMMISRGVAYWRGGDDAEETCGRRVLLATLDARLLALDAATGRPCADFGEGGEVDLLRELAPVADPWEYNVTSPPTLVGDVVVVGSSIADTIRRVAPPGDVQAFDVRSGRRLWVFHTIPHPGEAGHDTWEDGSWRESGGANVWTTMTADPERGLVFLPVSSASPDFYGGDRPGANLFSEALVAVDAATGERRWHFQTVHHDIWDYDLPAPPVAVRLRRGESAVDALVQVTKTGLVFVLDRDTGEPVLPVEERAVPASDVPGERAWPTQPFPVRPPPLVPHRMRESDLWDADPDHHAACLAWFRRLRTDGIFTPPSLEGTLVYPSNGGGANWSGAAWDPEAGRLFVPVNDVAHVVKLKPVWGGEGNLDELGARPTRGYLRALWFLLSGRGTGLRYITHPITGRTLFSRDGRPCNRPPWGELVAVDLERGEIAWRAPAAAGAGEPGRFAYGPALATAGGLVFHAGTREASLRAHDADTGELLASFPLPAGLHAGPVTYRVRTGAGPAGRQLLVVAPGGHPGVGSPPGDWVIAYGLPERSSRSGMSSQSAR